MGIGFVLIAWLFIFGIIAIPISIGIACSNYFRRKSGKTTVSPFGIFKRAIIPFALIFYGLFSFIVYGIFCETVRGVDPGIGDGWEVPIKSGYKFCMIDQTNDGYLMKGGCSGEPIIDSITQINLFGDSIVGYSNGYFVFDLKSEKKESVNDSSILSSYSTKLLSADNFYGKQRGSGTDLAAALIFSLPPIWYFRRKWKLRKTAKELS